MEEFDLLEYLKAEAEAKIPKKGKFCELSLSKWYEEITGEAVTKHLSREILTYLQHHLEGHTNTKISIQVMREETPDLILISFFGKEKDAV